MRRAPVGDAAAREPDKVIAARAVLLHWEIDDDEEVDIGGGTSYKLCRYCRESDDGYFTCMVGGHWVGPRKTVAHRVDCAVLAAERIIAEWEQFVEAEPVAEMGEAETEAAARKDVALRLDVQPIQPAPLEAWESYDGLQRMLGR